MTRTLSRHRLLILLLVASLAVAGLAAGCGDSKDTTTTVSSTGASSTDTTAAGATDSTIVEGGKTLDQYRADIPELEKKLASNPEDLESLEALAVAHYQLGEYDGAIAAYQKIIALTEDPQSLAFIHNALGNVYRDQKKFDLAIPEYEQAMTLDPTLKHPYINLAGVYKAMGELDKAMAVLEKAKTALNGKDADLASSLQSQLTTTTTAKK
jgi:tetratricopeptide (TPR) repeat protein